MSSGATRAGYPKALFTRYIFAHNIAIKRYCDKKTFFGPWISTGQGKLFKKIKVCFFRAYLGWSIETCVSKLSFYCISFYRNIVILFAKTSRVNKALKMLTDFWVETYCVMHYKTRELKTDFSYFVESLQNISIFKRRKNKTAVLDLITQTFS